MDEALLSGSRRTRDLEDAEPRLFAAIDAAQGHLVQKQSSGGYWQAELNGDATLESDAVMLMHYMRDVDVDRQRRLLNYVRSQQNPDGGWGESCRSYNEPSLKGKGPSTPSQTAWAVLGLLATGALPKDPAVKHGIDWILSRQRDDGTWDEDEHTGTGFPRVFYLVYTMYRHYFPLLALQAAAEATGLRKPATDRFDWVVSSSGRRN